jgi:AcrR family transcriptional regulator
MELALASNPVAFRSARKAKGQGGERREEILEHAQRLFAAHGVQSVSTRHIADAVGISQPSLYAYFPKRSDLLDEVSTRAFAKLSASAEAAMNGQGDPVEQMIRSYIRFGLEQPEAYRIAFMLEGLNETEKDPCIEKPGLRAFGMLREIMAARLGAHHPQLETASQSIWAAMHGLVALFLARSEFPWVDQQDLIDWHVAALLKGLPETAA